MLLGRNEWRQIIVTIWCIYKQSFALHKAQIWRYQLEYLFLKLWLIIFYKFTSSCQQNQSPLWLIHSLHKCTQFGTLQQIWLSVYPYLCWSKLPWCIGGSPGSNVSPGWKLWEELTKADPNLRWAMHEVTCNSHIYSCSVWKARSLVKHIQSSSLPKLQIQQTVVQILPLS